MGTSKEYLLLSIFSYCNLNKYAISLNLKSALKKIDFKTSFSSTIFLSNYNENYEKYFSKELEEWSIFDIDDRTGKNNKITSNSGFYAIIFNKKDEYVIAYRGSETYPFEEAYKDFIETDLRIGLGKKPLQFWEGLEVFENLLKKRIPFNKISITGHSLGGGIAQFVALILYKKYEFLPYVYTWNSVGINRDGIIGFEDFIEYDSILDSCKLTENEKIIFSDFKDSYLSFLIKELKKEKVIKDSKTILVKEDFNFSFNINNTFLKNLIKETNLKKILSKLTLQRQKELLIKEKIIIKFFQTKNLIKNFYKALKFIELLNENKIFNDRIFNFCHSKDLVSFLFPHFGVTYQVDKNFLKKDTERRFIKNLFIFNKSFQNYHFEDVFIPFLSLEGNFKKVISIDYVSSVLRKVIYSETTFNREFLGAYFSKTEISEENYLQIKKEIIMGIEKSKENILYKEKVLNRIINMKFEEIKILWFKVIKKFPSPYISQDIYDLIIFKFFYK